MGENHLAATPTHSGKDRHAPIDKPLEEDLGAERLDDHLRWRPVAAGGEDLEGADVPRRQVEARPHQLIWVIRRVRVVAEQRWAKFRRRGVELLRQTLLDALKESA